MDILKIIVYIYHARLQEAIEIHETFKARFLMGQIYWKMGESDQAYYTKAYTEFLKVRYQSYKIVFQVA